MKFGEITEAIESIDLTPFYLLVISTGTILYSCANSIRVLFGQSSQERRPSFLQATEEAQEEITLKSFLLMLIGASITLVILYYLLDSILIFLKCILTFSCFVTVCFVTWDYFNLIIRNQIGNYITYAFSLFLCIYWFITENWLITNLLAFCICVSGISLIKVGKYQIVLAIAIGFLIYDVWWVFLSPKVFGESVMVEAATGMSNHVPAMFTIPKTLSEKDTLIEMRIYSPTYSLGKVENSNRIAKIRLVEIPICFELFFSKIKNVNMMFRKSSESLIGCGDIVIPGIVLDFFLRFDTINYNLNVHSNTFLVAFAGYFVGVALSWIMVKVMEQGQPALLWIFPSVLIPTTIYAVCKGVFKLMWSRGAPIFSDDDSQDNENRHHDNLNDINDMQNGDNDEVIVLNESNDEMGDADDNTKLNSGKQSNVDIMKEAYRKDEPRDVKVVINEEEEDKSD